MLIWVSPLLAGIYIGTDATPPQSYQADSNYPTGVVAKNTSANQRDCHLYYDGKGPIPPLTCGVAPNGNMMVASTSTAVKPVTPVVQTPLVKPITPVLQTPAVKPITPVVQTPAVKPATTASASSNASLKPPLPLTSPTKDVASTQTPLAHLATATPVVKAKPAPKPLFQTTALPGSLKGNVERMVAQSHWGTVVWNLPVDYNWQGTMPISAPDIQGALQQLLAQYPVQAVFYDENHIVSVEPRRVI